MSNALSGLADLMAPNSIALIGASDDVRRIGGRPLRYLREAGFKGAVYPVNPNRDTVQGIKAYSSVTALPETPDVAILAVPAAGTIAALRECAEKQVKSAIVFSAGFAETGTAGRKMQDEMAHIAREAGICLLGPNCLGVFNSGIGYYGTFSAMLDSALVKPGPVAVVSQSGAYGSHITHLARERGLGIGYFITTGNESVLGVAQALRWVVEQPDVNVVMAYVEGVGDRDIFVEALESARKNRKAIVFMKVGKSEVGAHAVTSHTAALAGSDAVFDAVFRQYGVWRAATTAEQLDIAHACSRGVYPKSNGLGIFTMSGGFGIQMADDAEASGLDVVAMPEDAQAKLKAILPYASPRNPVDATAQVLTDPQTMTQFIATMLEKGHYDFFAGIFGSGPASPSYSEMLREILLTVSKASQDTIMTLTMSAPPEIVHSYEELGFLVHEDGSALMNMLGALVHFGRSFDSAHELQHAVSSDVRVDAGTGPVSEMAAQRILSQVGISFPPCRLVQPGGDIRVAADEIGFPQVLKIVSPDIAHKTEIGGVVVGIGNADEAENAFTTILDRVAEKCPDARIEGVMVSRFVPDGVEIIAGTVRDPVFGPVVMFGLGGIFVEVLKDVSFRVAPFSVEEAKRMIGEIRGFPLLQGVRGASPADIEALAEMLSALSVFAAANSDLVDSVDLNPVKVLEHGKGVIALDALIVTTGEGRKGGTDGPGQTDGTA